jgi:hypothetical protein
MGQFHNAISKKCLNDEDHRSPNSIGEAVPWQAAAEIT